MYKLSKTTSLVLVTANFASRLKFYHLPIPLFILFILALSQLHVSSLLNFLLPLYLFLPLPVFLVLARVASLDTQHLSICLPDATGSLILHNISIPSTLPSLLYHQLISYIRCTRLSHTTPSNPRLTLQTFPSLLLYDH